MKLLSNKVRARINWLHKIFLLPVILLATLSIGLRFGLPVPEAAQVNLSNWLQDLSGINITTHDAHIELNGRSVSVVAKAIKTQDATLGIQEFSLSFDALDLLFKQSLSSINMHIEGLQGEWVQNKDLSWKLKGFHLFDDLEIENLEIENLEIDNLENLESSNQSELEQLDFNDEISLKTGLSALLDSLSYIKLTQSYWLFKPHQGKPFHVSTPEAFLSKASNNTLLLSIQAYQGYDDPEVALSQDDVSDWSLSGQVWISQLGEQTSIRANNMAITGTHRNEFLDFGADITMLIDQEIARFQLNNIAGSLGDLSWPVKHLYGAVHRQLRPSDDNKTNPYNQQQWILNSPKVNLQQATLLIKQFDVPKNIATPIQQLDPDGHLMNAYFYWQTPPDNLLSNEIVPDELVEAKPQFLFTGTMQNIFVKAWQGVPAIKRANGNINLTSTGGKVTVNNTHALDIHLPLVTDTPWQFQSMVGEVAWQIGTDFTLLKSSRITSVPVQADQPFYAHFEGKFSHESKSTSTLEIGLEMPNYALRQAIPMLPRDVTIPEPIQDLDLAGYFAVDVDLNSPPVSSDNLDNQPIIDYKVAITAQDLEGFWQEREISLSHLSGNLLIDTVGLQGLRLQGQADGYPAEAKLIPKVDYKTLYNPIDIAIWQAGNLEKSQDLWLEVKANADHQYLLNKIIDDGSNNPLELPDETGQLQAYIPMCFFEERTDCQHIHGNYTFTDSPLIWPIPIPPLQALSFIWQDKKSTPPLSVENSPANLPTEPYASLALASQINNTTGIPAYQANLHFEKETLKGVGLGLGTQAPYVTQDTYIDVKSESLDLENWYTALSNISISQQQDAPLVLPSTLPPNINNIQITRATQTSDPLSGLPPLVAIEAYIEKLAWQDVLIEGADLVFKRQKGDWVIIMQSETLVGNMIIPQQEKPIELDIQYAHFKDNSEEEKESTTDIFNDNIDLLAQVDPTELPDINFNIKNISIGKRDYGSWQGELRQQNQALYIQNVNAVFGYSSLSGNMTWELKEGQHTTYFSGSANTQKVADVLENWGYEPTINANYGALDVHLSWLGSPLGFNLDKAKGNVSLYIKNGYINNSLETLKPLKVIALLDLSRLLGEIRPDLGEAVDDVLEFDSLYANYKIDNGLMHTLEPATLVAPALELSLQGYVDLVEQTLDNDLYITLPIADKLSLIALLTGAPQLGGMLYLVEKLIGRELKAFTTARYTLKGDLDAPKFTLEKIGGTNAPAENLGERLDSITQLQ